MNKQHIRDLFDDERYQKVIELTNPYTTENVLAFELLYYLKSVLASEKFEIKNKREVKKLFFYYFYLLGKVEFENEYHFSFSDELQIGFLNFDSDIKKLKNYKNYFHLGKNEVFLNKIIDQSIPKNTLSFRDDAKIVCNIVDFFFLFTHECSELYAFSGEHFPLFKWLINELLEN